MVDISRVRVGWSGAGVVGPGVSTFYTTGTGAALVSAVADFYDDIKNLLPAVVNIDYPGGGEVLDSATGDFVGAWTGTSGLTTPGAGAGLFAQGVGARVIWDTNGTTNHRRVRGSTFLVPLVAAAYSADGTLADATRIFIRDAAQVFRTTMGGAFVIWTRPKNHTGGGVNSTTGVRVPDGVTTLRSRRT